MLDATGVALVPELRMVGFDDDARGLHDEGSAVSTRARPRSRVAAPPCRRTRPPAPPRREPARATTVIGSAAGAGCSSSGSSLVVLVAIAYGVSRSPLLAVDTLQVRGTSHLTAPSRSRRPPASTRATRWCGSTPAQAVDGIEALPYVRDATLHREWPDTVRITVHERTPAAWIDGPGGKALVDGTGRVLETVDAAPPATAPAASGRRSCRRPGAPIDAVGAARVAGALTGLAAAGTTSVEATDHGIVLHLAAGPEVRMGERHADRGEDPRRARGAGRARRATPVDLRRRERADQPGGRLTGHVLESTVPAT